MNRELQPVDHFLTGPADQLANVLRAADARGHLVSYGRPRRLADGQYSIDVTLLEPVKDRSTNLRRVMLAAGTVASLAAVAALGWGLWLFLQWLAAHWIAIAGAIALVIVVAGLMVGKREDCAGLHCRGCGHR